MRKLKVDMSELEFAFEDSSPESCHYLDSETGEILLIMDDFDNEESGKLSKEMEANPGRYIEIPKAQSYEGYEDMADFADTVEDHNLQEKLAIALNGKGAFRRFKDVLFDYPKEREEWFEFKSKRLRQRIKEWLEDEGLEVQDGEIII